MSNEQEKPKFLVPWTCPKCGCLCNDVVGFKDYNEAVGYFQTCDECGCRFTHWENVAYTPYCVEVDGVEYEYPRPPDAAAQALDVLAEFVTEVEVTYGDSPDDNLGPQWEELEAEWPDLLVIYRKAKKALARRKPEYIPDPVKDKNTTPKNEAFWQGAETGLYGGRQKRLDVPTYDEACEQEVDWTRLHELTVVDNLGLRIVMGDPASIESPNVCFERAVDRWRLFIHIDGGDPFCYIEITDAKAVITTDQDEKPILEQERVL